MVTFGCVKVFVVMVVAICGQHGDVVRWCGGGGDGSGGHHCGCLWPLW